MARRPHNVVPDLTAQPDQGGALGAELSDDALAKAALRAILADPLSPAAARQAAARTILELTGALGRNALPPRDPGRPLTELTLAELEAELGAEPGDPPG
jgi:hypothetical protein